MENKIKQYVDYQFRFDKREDLEELKAEIVGNLIDRYHEYVHAGKSEEEAYVEAIKSMGDFSESEENAIPEEYSVKPSIPDILLMSGAILSIFGLLITLFSAVTGTIVTAISILLFSGSAYYLYSYSQYVRKEQMDIEKHNLLLRKIFKYMKTSFIFWALSLSFILAALIMNIITKLALMNADPRDLTIHSVSDYIRIYIVLYIIALIVCLFIFKNIYERLMHHYYILTGTTNIKGKIRESYDYLYGIKNGLSKKRTKIYDKFILYLGIVMIGIHLIIPFGWEAQYDQGYRVYENIAFVFGLIELLFSSYGLIVILPVIALLLNIIMFIKAFRKRINIKHVIIGYYFWFSSTISIFLLEDFIGVFFPEAAVGHYAVVMLIVLTLIVIVRKVYKKKQIIKGDQ